MILIRLYPLCARPWIMPPSPLSPTPWTWPLGVVFVLRPTPFFFFALFYPSSATSWPSVPHSFLLRPLPTFVLAPLSDLRFPACVWFVFPRVPFCPLFAFTPGLFGCLGSRLLLPFSGSLSLTSGSGNFLILWFRQFPVASPSLACWVVGLGRSFSVFLPFCSPGGCVYPFSPSFFQFIIPLFPHRSPFAAAPAPPGPLRSFHVLLR